MILLLMGLRGSGKTTVGHLLARQLCCPFVDLDERVLATFAETTVTGVWSAHGEDAWRDAETRELQVVLGEPDGDVVIALGGGTPMIERARAALEAARAAGTAKVVYLRCDPGELTRRLAAETGDRPSLTGADPAEEADAVLARREPVFRQLADHEVDVTTASPREVAGAVRELADG